MTSKKRRFAFLTVILIVLLVVSFCALSLGSYQLSLEKIYSIVSWKFGGAKDVSISKMDEIVLINIRFPRLIMAILIGIALSSAGTTYQACFKNPLVEPYILGASAGAALGAALAILYPDIFISLNLSAFLFSLFAVFLSYTLAKTPGGVSVVALVLSGIIVSSIFMASVSMLKYISEDSQLREITFWLMGGLYYSSWSDVPVASVVILTGFLALWILSWKLNLLSLGDEVAKSLGINPEFYKFIFIILATLISAICVSLAGVIAWIGLMMPHAARLLVGPDNRWVLPIAAVLGASYLLICDTLARNLSVSEIPVGIITSVLGAPFLIWLLRAKSKELR